MRLHQVEEDYYVSIVLENAYACCFSLILAYFFIARYFLEAFLLPRWMKKSYTDMDVTKQRSLTSNVLWLMVKLCLVSGAYPFFKTALGNTSMGDPVRAGSSVMFADWLSVYYMAIIGMFVWEIIYRLKVSPVSLIHHVAGITLSISQQVAHISSKQDPANDARLRILLLYGAFEVAFETFPHIAVVFYRLYPNRNRACSRIWFVSGCSSLIGSLGEIACVGVFLWRYWDMFDTTFKILMPLLHGCFLGAQLQGARIGFSMAKHYKRRHVKAIREATEEEKLGYSGVKGRSVESVDKTDEDDKTEGTSSTAPSIIVSHLPSLPMNGETQYRVI